MDGVPRREDAQRARGLLRVEPDRKMTRFGARLQLAQGLGVHARMAHVHFEAEVAPQGIGPLHNNIKGLDAVNGDVALGQDLGFSAVDIYADKNA